MQKLNLPTYEFRFRNHQGKEQIFDVIRKKFVALTPEEWVRQNLISFLIHHQKYSPGLIAVEMPVKVNGLNQRADIVVYNRKGMPSMIVECKAPAVAITKSVFDQAARYNMKLQVDYMMVTNGLQHFCAQLTDDKGAYQMLQEIPTAELVIGS
ncbi:type I restriction enzyme HsdR N-terminal domain-containing protein [Carboxylicivirga caseinilyticus]|uniref:type I restriction enzyme HsdR N-terminal domain-containing protein n=1 Tax=Carboxylicivirga caseinilyticus TaxID=3417572 RepID=UPI003D340C30|nr:type I restriction enzyme HsdR N-terminal domain-containing protein [Marinilabiliaceae bacterium A049]